MAQRKKAQRKDEIPTTDRLRHDIDSGRSGDKVPFIDPAAAPLGTDDEAAGTSPGRLEMKKAQKAEIRPDAPASPVDERGRTISGELTTTSWFWIYVAIAVLVVIGIVAFLIAR